MNIGALPLPERRGLPQEVEDTLLTEEPAFLTRFIRSGLFASPDSANLS